MLEALAGFNPGEFITSGAADELEFNLNPFLNAPLPEDFLINAELIPNNTIWTFSLPAAMDPYLQMQLEVGNKIVAEKVHVEVELGTASLFMHYDAEFGILKADPKKIKQLRAEDFKITYVAQITLTSPYTGLKTVYSPFIQIILSEEEEKMAEEELLKLKNSKSSELSREEELAVMEDQWLKQVEIHQNSTAELKNKDKGVDVRVKSVSSAGRVELTFSQAMFVPVEEVLKELIQETEIEIDGDLYPSLDIKVLPG